MKATKFLQLPTAATIGLGLGTIANCQTYFLSIPLGNAGLGAPPIEIQDASYVGRRNLQWGTLTETIYIDPVAQTIRQVGLATVEPSSSTIVFNETRQIPRPFPTPPETIPATVTVNLGLSNGGFSFDTGPRPLAWSETAQAYTFDASVTEAFLYLALIVCRQVARR